ncbi:MAG TPA: hypothetical protein VE172_02945, partial [Stackebrandtia sp.]|uniref:hypothetical protein n=1 Tax=Stackebrandtia sp. TaxID=2023065 RepID=UPI002D649177
MAVVEFWPEYGSGPLWLDGAAVEPATLVDADLAERLIAWNAVYADAKLPLEGDGDAAWIRRGGRLLGLVRRQLAGTHEVVVT